MTTDNDIKGNLVQIFNKLRKLHKNNQVYPRTQNRRFVITERQLLSAVFVPKRFREFQGPEEDVKPPPHNFGH